MEHKPEKLYTKIFGRGDLTAILCGATCKNAVTKSPQDWTSIETIGYENPAL